MSGRIACLGEGMIELARRPDGLLGQGYGGDTMNTAVYLARLGVAADYVTALGDDPESQGMVDLLARERVGTELILRVPGRLPGLYMIDVDEAGERRFLYWRDNAPARDLFTLPQAAGLADRLGAFDMLYVSGISLAIWGEAGRAVFFALLDRLRRTPGPGGIRPRVAFDTNWRPRLWPDLATAQAAYRAMLARTDIALPGEHDLHQLFDGHGRADILATLREAGIGEACLRLAEPGCLVAHAGDETLVAAHAVARVVDTTAAGDSFSAGYLAARLAGHTPSEAARTAHALAAIVIQHRGAIVPPQATAPVALALSQHAAAR